MRHDRVPPARELERDFHLAARVLTPWPIGFESECWIVDQQWFVKVARDPNQHFQLTLLDVLADAGIEVPRPLRTDATHTDDGRPYAVFPYVIGRHATPEDFAATARLLRRVHDLDVDALPPPTPPPDTDLVEQLYEWSLHPWIGARRDELAAWLDRLERVSTEADNTAASQVLSHDDLDGLNVLIGDDGAVAAALDWDRARLGPREHDLWTVIDHPYPAKFLQAYGVDQLTIHTVHVELAMLRRSLADIAARVIREIDRPGIATWGFDRLARIDATMAIVRRSAQAA